MLCWVWVVQQPAAASSTQQLEAAAPAAASTAAGGRTEEEGGKLGGTNKAEGGTGCGPRLGRIGGGPKGGEDSEGAQPKGVTTKYARTQIWVGDAAAGTAVLVVAAPLAAAAVAPLLPHLVLLLLPLLSVIIIIGGGACRWGDRALKYPDASRCDTSSTRPPTTLEQQRVNRHKSPNAPCT